MSNSDELYEISYKKMQTITLHNYATYGGKQREIWSWIARHMVSTLSCRVKQEPESSPLDWDALGILS